MDYGYVKVAAITPRIKVADVQYNKTQIITLMGMAAEVGAEIMVYPQLCITGVTCQDLFYQKTLIQGAAMALADIVKASSGIKGLIFVGLPLEYGDKLYNVAAVISNGRLMAFVPASTLKEYGESSDMRYFVPGEREVVNILFQGMEVPFGANILFEDALSGVRTACELGADLGALDSPGFSHTKAGALIIANLSGDAYSTGKAEYRRVLISGVSGSLVCGYICANAGEGESTQDLVFAGERTIGENGIIITRGASFTAGITYGEIDTELLSSERARMNTWPVQNKAHLDKYLVLQYNIGIMETIKGLGDMIKGSFDKKNQEKPAVMRKYSKSPFVPDNSEERARRCEEILMVQALGLKKRLMHINAKTAVIGISGGLDSTLALLVAAKAFDMLKLPRDGITAVTMPGFGTTDRTYDNACSLARTMGLTLKEISIADAVRGHFKDIGQDENNHDITYENSQARERTQILMDLANMTGALMIGTGDLSELALGWATYNGDHMSMYGVNGGIPKTLVRHVVRCYADIHSSSSIDSDKELASILYDILDTPVSPELLPPSEGEMSQKTEDLVGPYELHDFFLYYMLRYGFSPSKIYAMAVNTFEEDYEPEVIKKWLGVCVRRFFAQHFKRTCLPDGPRIGSVGISPRGGLKMPTDACGALWLKEIESL